MKSSVNVCWLRRDLRLQDHAALYHALRSDRPVLLLFIFDQNILGKLDNKSDPRVEFIYTVLEDLQAQLEKSGAFADVRYGTPASVFSTLITEYDIGKVYCNEDYEPYATGRDEEIKSILKARNISFHSVKDQVIFSRDEVMKEDGSPYTVFTPYSIRWLALAQTRHGFYFKPYPTEKYYKNFFQGKKKDMPSLASLGFVRTTTKIPSKRPDPEIISHYAAQRDFPGIDGTSRLGIHLRFGTISIRKLATEAKKRSAVFLKELIWRDFYQMILWHFPKLGSGHTFKPAYEKIKWRNDEQEFELWCAGKTGYPLVDAGMRQLNQTGFMHNRIRMVTASFLSKHLLIDWRWGEAYFAEKLLDYDLAANNGGWQWSAGSGCDAAPYFRVFNPTLQQKKFDPEGVYIKKWLPDYQELSYPAPIVEHGFARERALRVYQEALNG